MENSRDFSASSVSSCEGQHMVGVSAPIQVQTNGTWLRMRMHRVVPDFKTVRLSAMF